MGPCGSIGWAVEQMRQGRRVCRVGWNGKGMFLFLVPGSTFTVNRPPLLGIYPEGTEINYQGHVDMKTANGTIVPWMCSQSEIVPWMCSQSEIVPWMCSQSDLLATDWILAD